MAQISSVVGVKKVIARMKRKEAKWALQSSVGLKAAGLLLQRASQRLAPVDFGNLKASAFTRAKGVGFGTEVEVGYTANYALFVHELVGMKLKGRRRTAPSKGRYWDPQGRAQAKFLEEPSRTERVAMRVMYQKFMSK